MIDPRDKLDAYARLQDRIANLEAKVARLEQEVTSDEVQLRSDLFGSDRSTADRNLADMKGKVKGTQAFFDKQIKVLKNEIQRLKRNF
jgi:uncharacterized small protein (DUF1192 family)